MLQIWKYSWKIQFLKYSNNRTAIAFKWENNSPVWTLTINLPDLELKNDEVFLNSNIQSLPVNEIKSNLKKEWIILEELGEVKSGFCFYPKVRINLDLVK